MWQVEDTLVEVHKLLIALASPVVEHRLYGAWSIVVVACGFSSCDAWA